MEIKNIFKEDLEKLITYHEIDSYMEIPSYELVDIIVRMLQTHKNKRMVQRKMKEMLSEKENIQKT